MTTKKAKTAKKAKTPARAAKPAAAKTGRDRRSTTPTSNDGVSPGDVKRALFDLNDVGHDTLDEGAYTRWKFTGLERQGDDWVLRYTNSGHPDGDYVRFHHAGDCVEKGQIAKKWEDAAFKALALENRDDDFDDF